MPAFAEKYNPAQRAHWLAPRGPTRPQAAEVIDEGVGGWALVDLTCKVSQPSLASTSFPRLQRLPARGICSRR